MVNVYVDGSFIPKTRQGSYGVIIKKDGGEVKIGGKLGEIMEVFLCL